MLDVHDAKPRLEIAIADIAPDRSRSPTCACAHHNPGGLRVLFCPHLIKDALGDVVVASPVSRAFGIGELIKIVSAGLFGQLRGGIVNCSRAVDKMATSAEA